MDLSVFFDLSSLLSHARQSARVTWHSAQESSIWRNSPGEGGPTEGSGRRVRGVVAEHGVVWGILLEGVFGGLLARFV